MKFMMRTTNEYERLVQFFVKNGLEFDGDEEVDTDIIKCWKMVIQKKKPVKEQTGMTK